MSKSVSQANRRIVERDARSVPVTVNSVGGRPLPAILRDISVRGLGLLSCNYYPTGTLLKVRIPVENGTLDCDLTAIVKRATPQTDGRWVIGCQWVRKLDEDEVFTLG